jgi:hypothetical protein
MPCITGTAKHILCKPGCPKETCPCTVRSAHSCRPVCCRDKLAEGLNTQISINDVRASICDALTGTYDDAQSICEAISGNVISAYCSVDIILKPTSGDPILLTKVQNGECIDTPTDPEPGTYAIFADGLDCDAVLIN